ncbi:MAG TPA: ATP-binding protein [Acidimicrobiales bacterium]|nr:ATP-binding protein [Acidimicrobiales bacterium]
MNLTVRLRTVTSALRLQRRTVRLRLTLLYSGLFLGAAAGLLTITYFLARSASSGGITKSLLAQPGSPASKPAATRLPTGFVKFSSPGLSSVQSALKQKLKAQAFAAHSIDMHEVLVWSGVALAFMAVLTIALGWLVAGRVLRPLRTMSNATQQITEHNLHDRLALPGPSDEIKDLADTIDGLLQRLEAAFDAQRGFVANASHELRTPLTLNRALLEVTLADPHATVDDLRAMSQELIDSGEQQERLIEALLTLATSARGLERHEPFDLGAITTGVLLAPHPEIDELGLDLQSRISPAPAVGDPRLAERLVTNLLDNALRHNVASGHVNVVTRTESARAVLAIANDGPIIRPEDLDRLFEPFQRLDTDRATHAEGHGLGLSIVRAIADAHRATVSAVAGPEGGLSVAVSFPLLPARLNHRQHPTKDLDLRVRSEGSALPHSSSANIHRRAGRSDRGRRTWGARRLSIDRAPRGRRWR